MVKNYFFVVGNNLIMSFKTESVYLRSRINQVEKDPFFKEVIILTNKDIGDKFMKLTRKINEREYNNVFENIKKLEGKNHPNLIKIFKISSSRYKNIYTMNTFYQDPKKSLKKEIEMRKKKENYLKKIFSMEELTHLLYNILEIFTFLEEKRISHGDLNPNSIFYDDKFFKIALIPDLYKAPEKYQCKKILNNEDIYVSPVIYKAVKLNKLDKVVHAPFKSDLFSFGLCILEAGLNESIQSIYGDYNINQSILEEKIKKFEKIYSKNPLLIISLKKMLSVDEKKRPTFSTLKKALPDYKIICDHFEKIKKNNTKQVLLRNSYSKQINNKELVKDALKNNILSNQKKFELSDKEISFDNIDYFSFTEASTKKNPYFQDYKKQKSTSSIKYTKRFSNKNIYSGNSISNKKISKDSYNSPIKPQKRILSTNYQSINFGSKVVGDFKVIDGKLYKEVKPVFNENLYSMDFSERKNGLNIYHRRSYSNNGNIKNRFSNRRVDVYGDSYQYRY